MKQKLYTLALAACAALFPAAADANTQQVSIFDNLNFTPNNKVEFVKESPELFKAAPEAPMFADTKKTRTNAAFGLGGYLWGSAVQWKGFTLYGNDVVEYLPDLDVVVYKEIDYDWDFNNVLTRAETSLNLRIYDQNGTRLSDSLDVFKVESGMGVWGITKVINPDPANKDIRKCSFLYYSNVFFPTGGDGRFGGHAAYFVKDGKVSAIEGKEQIKAAEGYNLSSFEFIGITPKNGNFNFYSSADFRAAEGSSVPTEQPNILIGEYNNGSFSIDLVPQFHNDFVRPNAGFRSKGKPVMEQYDDKLYYFTVSPFNKPEADVKLRVPALNVSSDDGYSFKSEFEKMPKEVMSKFLKENNLIPDGVMEIEITTAFVAFRDMALKVYGPDKMSAVTTLILENQAAGDEFMGLWLVEITKDGANWDMKIVDDMTCMIMDPQINRYRKFAYGTTALQMEEQSATEDPVPGVDYAVISGATPRSRELDLATTKDGKYLVAKWIEHTYDDAIRIEGKKYYDTVAVETPAYTVYYEDTKSNTYKPDQREGVFTNQIMISYRDINGGKWSKPVSLTIGSNPNFFLHTHMPGVIPSLNNIPVFYTVGFILNEETMSDAAKNSVIWKQNMEEYKKLPEQVKRTFYSVGRSFVYGNFNIDAFDSVEEQIIATENNIGVFPNPATNEMTIKIDSETSATVEIYNMLGAKVMSFNGVVSAVTANVSNLANGMYMVKVIENGKERTSSFTIAR